MGWCDWFCSTIENNRFIRCKTIYLYRSKISIFRIIMFKNRSTSRKWFIRGTNCQVNELFELIKFIEFFRFLNDLRPFAPNEQEYKKLSFLLTLKRLQDHTDYHNWNPSAGRVQCFHEVFPLVHRFLQVWTAIHPRLLKSIFVFRSKNKSLQLHKVIV